MGRRVTLHEINCRLAVAGHAERIARGNGYFYFYGGSAGRWPLTSVAVAKLNALTLDEWVAEFQQLKGTK